MRRSWVVLTGVFALVVVSFLVGSVSGVDDDEAASLLDDLGGGELTEEQLEELMQMYGGGMGGGFGEDDDEDFGSTAYGAHGDGYMPPEDDDDDGNSMGEPLVVNNPKDSTPYAPPQKPQSAAFLETFQSGDDALETNWIYSKRDRYNGKFAVGGGRVPAIAGDVGLIATEQARHYGIISPLKSPISVSDVLVLQYELRLDAGLTCSGAYLKFPTTPLDTQKLDEFDDSVPYSVMFGPDKCGDTNKVHLILQSRHPETGALTEHHLVDTPAPYTFGSETHLYTAVVDVEKQTYEVRIDGETKRAGSLRTDFNPPFEPPKEIDDVNDSKPDDWVDEPQMADPKATKPSDWDEDAPEMIVDESAKMPEGWLENEPEEIPDAESKKPEEWDDEEDGEWTPDMVPNPKCEASGCGKWSPPEIPNPQYKGKWEAPLVPNPDYKGPWAPRKVRNEAFYEVDVIKPLDIAAVAIEIWAMDYGIVFDNVYVGTDVEDAEEYANATVAVKREVEAAELEAQRKARSEAEAASAKSSVGELKERALNAAEAVADALERVLVPVEAQLKKLGLEPHVNRAIDWSLDNPLIASAIPPLVLVLVFLVATATKSKKKREAPSWSGAASQQPSSSTPSSSAAAVEAESSEAVTPAETQPMPAADAAPVARPSVAKRRAGY